MDVLKRKPAICDEKLAKKTHDARKSIQKEKKKTFKYVFNKIRLKKCASAAISKPFPTYHVAYLGNVVTGWAKGEGCIEKPLATLWRNYIQSSRPDVNMHLTVSSGGLKAVTKNHGLTEYWAHRLTTCSAPQEFPRIFCWVYRHEGRRLRHELRCHAVLCSSSDIAVQIEKELKQFLIQALNEFKKEKISKQNARLSLVNSIHENATLPKRKILLGIGSLNYRPPLEYSKSAPKLSSIDEEEGETAMDSQEVYKNLLKVSEKNLFLYEQIKYYNGNCYNGTERIQSHQSLEPRKAILKNETEIKDTLVNPREGASKTSLNTIDEHPDLKLDLDFKIGGEMLPTIKEHSFVTPIISKGLMEQEQVSLVPVGESHTDFSSLKVYKKRNVYEGGKDFAACAMFLGAENVNQIENIFQSHCSFSSDRTEDELATKLNSTLIV